MTSTARLQEGRLIAALLKQGNVKQAVQLAAKGKLS